MIGWLLRAGLFFVLPLRLKLAALALGLLFGGTRTRIALARAAIDPVMVMGLRSGRGPRGRAMNSGGALRSVARAAGVAARAVAVHSARSMVRARPSKSGSRTRETA